MNAISWDVLQYEQLTSPLYSSITLQIPISMLCVPGLFACLLPKSNSMPSGLSQSSPLTFKTPGFKPWWLPEVMKLSSSWFPSQLLCGFVFLFSLVYYSVSPFLVTSAPSPLQQAAICFSLKPCRHTSCPLQCGLTSPFNCGVCFASLRITLQLIYLDVSDKSSCKGGMR